MKVTRKRHIKRHKKTKRHTKYIAGGSEGSEGSKYSKGSKSSKGSKYSKYSKGSKSSKGSKYSKYSKSSKYSKDLEGLKNSKSAKYSKDLEGLKNSKSAKYSNDLEGLKSSKYSKDLEGLKNSKSAKYSKDLEGLKNSKSAKYSNDLEGSKIYTLDGDIKDLKETHEGKYIFRKMTNKKRETEISDIIMKNPHENIVTIYKIVEPKDALDENSYIDMEKLNTDISEYDIKEIKEKMENVKKHLQGLGIMYIDWKPDNIGLGDDGKLKLFDFDLSGLIQKDTKKWVENRAAPKFFWAYQNALKAGKETPLEIDNYAFNEGFK
jgi:hypothetical protein